jgi:ribosome-binding factor A
VCSSVIDALATADPMLYDQFLNTNENTDMYITISPRVKQERNVYQCPRLHYIYENINSELNKIKAIIS